MNRKYGLILDRLSEESNVYSNGLVYKLKSFGAPTPTMFTASTGASLPESVDLRLKMSLVIDQGNIGSCTACAASSAYQTLDPSWDPSVLFLYYNTRLLDGNTNVDNGASVSQTVYALYKYGLCSNGNWPYLNNTWNIRPSQVCYTEGLEHQSLTYFNIAEDHYQLKSCLNAGYPIIVGIMVYSSFETQSVTQTGIVPMPTQGEQLLGGHCVLICGYNDSQQVYICKNSWGTTWGDNGYFYLPYGYISQTNNLASDLWVVTSVESTTEIQVPVTGATGSTGTETVVVPAPPPIPVDNSEDKIFPRFKIVPKLKKDITSSDLLLSSLKFTESDLVNSETV